MVADTYSTIRELHSAGDDALTNMFSLSFTEGLLTPANFTHNLEYRITDFILPDKVVGVHNKWYKGRKLPIPNGLDGDPKTTTFTFRADKAQILYKKLRQLAHMCKISPNLQTTLGFRSDIAISSLLNNGDVGTTWVLKGWFPTNIQGLTYSNANGEPLLVSVTGSFMNCQEPTEVRY